MERIMFETPFLSWRELPRRAPGAGDPHRRWRPSISLPDVLSGSRPEPSLATARVQLKHTTPSQPRHDSAPFRGCAWRSHDARALYRPSLTGAPPRGANG